MKIFCTKCNKQTEHTSRIAKTEFVFDCTVCKGFVKFPRTDSKLQLQTWIDEHNAVNVPVVPVVEEQPPAGMLTVLEEISKQ